MQRVWTRISFFDWKRFSITNKLKDDRFCIYEREREKILVTRTCYRREMSIVGKRDIFYLRSKMDIPSKFSFRIFNSGFNFSIDSRTRVYSMGNKFEFVAQISKHSVRIYVIYS